MKQEAEEISFTRKCAFDFEEKHEEVTLMRKYDERLCSILSYSSLRLLS